MKNERLAGIGYGLIAAVIWGGFPVVTRLGVTHSTLDSYDIVFIRFVVSGVLLLPVLLRGKPNGLGLVPALVMVVGVGAPYILLVATALSRAPVGYFALTPGSMIAFTAILGRFVIKETLSTAQKIGILTVLFGMGMAAFDVLSNTGGAFSITLFVLGGLLWAIYNVTTKRYAVSAIRATAIVSVGSALFYSPFYVLNRGLSPLLHAPIAAVAIQAIYQGVLVSILGLYFFSKAVSILGPAIGATFAALVPLLATIEAALLLKEQPHSLTLAGIAVVTIGMAASLVKRWSRPRLAASA
ncbi:DMT family transporter [Paraburkholderia sp. BL21I4N1]|uniref:DMT family transporter n=1 Tax=Paraburkholderia sp. BL21I4N1 TaxID=1938801 RepID=UPI000CFB5DA6|nr:DMT family transporter [Paraburkholderia sp. BL21I4N1]PQV54057.1 EamA-like transporter family protein [Paraburkholderia sp. BL21I4N1]